MRAVIAGVVLALTATLVGVSKAEALSHSTLTYCETYRHGQQVRTYMEFADGRDRVVRDVTAHTIPLVGRRHLVESAVFPRRKRVMDCRVRWVNGRRSAILTTFGGHEWRIVRPRG